MRLLIKSLESEYTIVSSGVVGLCKCPCEKFLSSGHVSCSCESIPIDGVVYRRSYRDVGKVICHDLSCIH